MFSKSITLFITFLVLNIQSINGRDINILEVEFDRMRESLIKLTEEFETLKSRNTCGIGWTAYSDTKCFKIVQNKGTASEAKETCSQLDSSSTLVTIGSEEEQQFLSYLLYDYNNISDNVWLGLELRYETYLWSDGNGISFDNWDENADKSGVCVEMSLGKSSLGKWRDDSCLKKYLIVCQKTQTTSSVLRRDVQKLTKLVEQQQQHLGELIPQSLNFLTQLPYLILGTSLLMGRFTIIPKEVWTEVSYRVKAVEDQQAEIHGLKLNISQNMRSIELNQDQLKNHQEQIVSSQNEKTKLKLLNSTIENHAIYLNLHRDDLGNIQNYLLNISKIIIGQHDQLKINQESIFNNEKDLAHLNEVCISHENFNKEVAGLKNELDNKTKSVQAQIDSFNAKTIPIGFVYTQYPLSPSPEEIWPQMKWTQITEKYAGYFFRAEGQGSEKFGTSQSANQSYISDIKVQSVSYSKWLSDSYTRYYTTASIDKQGGKWTDINAEHLFDQVWLYMTPGEVRPKNMAIKIWIRTG